MKGWRVLVASPSGEETCRRLAKAGAVPVAVPTIAIRPIASPDLDAALERLAAYDWIVMTSANGVAAVFDRLRALGKPVPAGPRWAAVGPKTAAALEARGVAPEAVPESGVGAAIPAGMGDLDGSRVLLARAVAAGEDLPAILRARGAEVDAVAAYETVEGPPESRGPLAAALEAGLDAAIFTSGSTARGFVALAGDAAALAGAVVVAIGPSTAAAAREAGLEPDAIADERSPEGLVAALAGASSGRLAASGGSTASSPDGTNPERSVR